MHSWRVIFSAVAVVALACVSAEAQQPQPPPPQPQQAPAQQPGEWAKLPRMRLERQFAGPLQDTIVQRWRDPVDGTVCYIYLPITAAHSAPTQAGFVQYSSGRSVASRPPLRSIRLRRTEPGTIPDQRSNSQ
jgi:hypothetical protein